MAALQSEGSWAGSGGGPLSWVSLGKKGPTEPSKAHPALGGGIASLNLVDWLKTPTFYPYFWPFWVLYVNGKKRDFFGYNMVPRSGLYKWNSKVTRAGVSSVCYSMLISKIPVDIQQGEGKEMPATDFRPKSKDQDCGPTQHFLEGILGSSWTHESFLENLESIEFLSSSFIVLPL